MEIYTRTRARRNSRKLVTTLLLGLAIGISAGIPIGISVERARVPETEPGLETEQAAAPSVVELAAPAAPGAPGAVDVLDAPPEAPDETETAAGQPPADAATPLDQLTALEDVWPARHLFVAVGGATLSDEERGFLAELKPGGVVLRQDNLRNREQTVELVRAVKGSVGLGEGLYDLPLIAVEQEGGALNRLGLENAPGAAELGLKNDVEPARNAGRGFAEACVSRGIGVLFAPVMDVLGANAPAGMEARSFGREQARVTALGLAFADGAMAGGVLPVVKYFPGLAAARQASPQSLAVIETTDIPLLAQVTYPFSEAARVGVPGVIVGHVAVPVLDPRNPERPASLSPALVQELLRGRLGFQGVILADDLAAAALGGAYTVEQAAVAALAAGCDALALSDASPEAIRGVCRAIEDAVEAGVLTRGQLAESKRRLEAWQSWLKAPQRLAGPLPALPAGGAAETRAAEAPATAQPPGTRAVRHEVQRGDTLSRLAGQHGVSQQDIVKWNNLPDTNIKLGTTLVIYVPDAAGAPATAPIEPPAEEHGVEPAPSQDAAPEPPEPIAAPEPAVSPAASSESVPGADIDASLASIETEEYTVQPGDSLGKLATRFQTSTRVLRALNDIQEANHIEVGQRLRVPKQYAAVE